MYDFSDFSTPAAIFLHDFINTALINNNIINIAGTPKPMYAKTSASSLLFFF